MVCFHLFITYQTFNGSENFLYYFDTLEAPKGPETSDEFCDFHYIYHSHSRWEGIITRLLPLTGDKL